MRRIGAAAAIILLLVGPVARPFIDAVLSRDHVMGFLGPLQFSLETIALGLLAGITRLIGVGGTDRARAPAMGRAGAGND